jgi:hypothetical protein
MPNFKLSQKQKTVIIQNVRNIADRQKENYKLHAPIIEKITDFVEQVLLSYTDQVNALPDMYKPNKVRNFFVEIPKIKDGVISSYPMTHTIKITTKEEVYCPNSVKLSYLFTELDLIDGFQNLHNELDNLERQKEEQVKKLELLLNNTSSLRDALTKWAGLWEYLPEGIKTEFELPREKNKQVKPEEKVLDTDFSGLETLQVMQKLGNNDA